MTSYVSKHSQIISCGTCKYSCRAIPGDYNSTIKDKGTRCLYDGELKEYHDWERYHDFKYSLWKPVESYCENLPEELFIIDV